MSETTGAILDCVGAFDMRYETTVIMFSLSSHRAWVPTASWLLMHRHGGCLT